MIPFSGFGKFVRKLPVHLALVIMCLLWIIPTLGLFITSFRSRQAVLETGWWTVFAPKQVVGATEYTTYCSSCHGSNGDAIAKANLSDPKVVNQFPSSASLFIMLKKPINGKPHLFSPQLPTPPQKALNTLASVETY